MDVSAFEELLDRHGSDLAAWPAGSRAAAAALVDTSPEASAARRAMSEVERFLRTPLASGAGGVDATAAVAMRQRQVAPSRRLALRTGWATAAAAALLLGIAIGDVGLPEHDDSPDHVIAAAIDTAGSVDVD